MAKYWDIGSEGPTREELSEIAGFLSEGEVLVLPTDTIYGLHALALEERAVSRIFEIKGRTRERALPVLFADLAQAKWSGVELTPEDEQALMNIWPAPLTALLKLRKSIPATAGARTVAARVPAVMWLRQLISLCGPLASTSANRTGKEPASDLAALDPEIEQAVAGIVNAGPLAGRPSTIVDFTSDPPRIVRAGEFLFTQNLWKKSRKTL